MKIIIRNAVLTDVEKIFSIIDNEASNKVLLERDRDDIASDIRSFVVAETDSEVLGCSSLTIWTKELSEIRSLSVTKSKRGLGIGKMIVEKLISEARNLGLKQVFALTTQHKFFSELGFKMVEFDQLPEKKIWNYCVKCKLLPYCNEKAFIRNVD